MYVLDIGNYRLQSFPFTTSTGSPNGTTIIGGTFFQVDPSALVFPSAMAFDRNHRLLYVINAVNNHLLILNITENDVQIINDTQLFVMGSASAIFPTNIVIDEASACFYVLARVLDFVSNILTKKQDTDMLTDL